MPQLYGEVIKEVGKPHAIAVSEHPRDCACSYMPVFYAGVRMAEMLAHSFGCPLYRTDHQSGHSTRSIPLGNLFSENKKPEPEW